MKIPGYLTLSEAAEILGGTDRWLRGLIAARRGGEVLRVNGKLTLIPAAALKNFPRCPGPGRKKRKTA